MPAGGLRSRCFRPVDRFELRQIPDQCGPIIACRRQRFAILCDCQRVYRPGVPSQAPAFPARAEIPYGHEVIVGARGERLAIGGKGERVNPRRLFVAQDFPRDLWRMTPVLVSQTRVAP